LAAASAAGRAWRWWLQVGPVRRPLPLRGKVGVLSPAMWVLPPVGPPVAALCGAVLLVWLLLRPCVV
jgi:hypothetical protein